MVFVLKQAGTAEGLLARVMSMSSRRFLVGNVMVYVIGHGYSLAVPENKVVLVGPPEDLQQILERRGRPDVSDEMRAGLDAARTPNALALVSVPESGLRLTPSPLGVALPGLSGPGGGVHVTTVVVRPEADEVVVQGVALCRDAATAEALGLQARQDFFLAPDAGGLLPVLEGAAIETDGTRVRLRLAVRVDRLVGALARWNDLDALTPKHRAPMPRLFNASLPDILKER
jgi:hypothetical protein